MHDNNPLKPPGSEITERELAAVSGGARPPTEELARLATFLLNAPRPPNLPAGMGWPLTLDFTPVTEINAPASVQGYLP